MNNFETKKNPTTVIAIGLSVGLAVSVGAVYYATNRTPSEAITSPPPAVAEQQSDAPEKTAPTAAPTSAEVDGTEVAEILYIPGNATLGERRPSALLTSGGMIPGNLRIRTVKAVTDPEKQGEFMRPRISPDGLQLLVTRPGFDGLYLVPARGGDPIKISDDNAWNSRWTKDGRIEVDHEDGTTSVYGADGTLQEQHPTVKNAEDVWAENDRIFANDAQSGAQMELTGNDDRFFNPVVSPDGSTVAYQGLNSGLYIAPTDGSREPIYVGPGSNPTWSPDGSGLVYDVTFDDGHHLTEGDIMYLDPETTTVSNLTEGDELIAQMPVIGPDGTTIIFESEGGIFLAELQ